MLATSLRTKVKTVVNKLRQGAWWCIFIETKTRWMLKLWSRSQNIFFRLFMMEINSAIMKPIRNMKMQWEIVYPNIYECVSDYRKIHHDRLWAFTDTLQTRQDSWWFNTIKWEQKYANSSNHYLAKMDFSLRETITVTISFRLFMIALMSPS